MGQFVLVCCIDKSIDTVVDILLNAVVDRRFGVAGTCSVIVNTQSATTIDIFDVIAHLMKGNVELSRLA